MLEGKKMKKNNNTKIPTLQKSYKKVAIVITVILVIALLSVLIFLNKGTSAGKAIWISSEGKAGISYPEPFPLAGSRGEITISEYVGSNIVSGAELKLKADNFDLCLANPVVTYGTSDLPNMMQRLLDFPADPPCANGELIITTGSFSTKTGAFDVAKVTFTVPSGVDLLKFSFPEFRSPSTTDLSNVITSTEGVEISLNIIPQDNDIDNDGIINDNDNCPLISNTNQADIDEDDVGDVCDNCGETPNARQDHSDTDTFGDACDNCPNVANEGQGDENENGIGDACENAPQTCTLPSGCSEDEFCNAERCGTENCPDCHTCTSGLSCSAGEICFVGVCINSADASQGCEANDLCPLPGCSTCPTGNVWFSGSCMPIGDVCDANDYVPANVCQTCDADTCSSTCEGVCGAEDCTADQCGPEDCGAGDCTPEECSCTGTQQCPLCQSCEESVCPTGEVELGGTCISCSLGLDLPLKVTNQVIIDGITYVGDYSGLNHNFMLGDGTTSSLMPAQIEGSFGYTFDGSNDYMYSAADVIGTGDVTVAVHLNTNDFVNKYPRIIAGDKFIITLEGGAGHRRVMVSSDGILFASSEFNIIEPNKDITIIVTRTSVGVTQIYYNGELKTKSGAATSGTPIANNYIYIGNQADKSKTFNGNIYSVKVFKCILTSEQITTLHQEMLITPVEAETSQKILIGKVTSLVNGDCYPSLTNAAYPDILRKYCVQGENGWEGVIKYNSNGKLVLEEKIQLLSQLSIALKDFFGAVVQ